MTPRAQLSFKSIYPLIVVVAAAFVIVLIVDLAFGSPNGIERCASYFGDNASYVGTVNGKSIDVCRLANGSLEVVPKNFTVS